MSRLIRRLSFIFALTALFAMLAKASTITAASCNTSDVQTAINSAAEGDTVIIPAGTCSWTTGVTISGKGIIVQGAGSGRIIAVSHDILTIATGTLNVNAISSRVDGTYPLGPTNGQTLRVLQIGNRQNWMQGTVTSFNSGTGVLVMNITSTSGTTANIQQHHWAVATIPQTVLSNNSTNAMFGVNEDTGFDTQISGIKFLQGTTTSANAYDIGISRTSGGKAVVVHDCWMEAGAGLGQIEASSNRGVVYNCSFDASPFSSGGLVNSALNVVPSYDDGIASWTTPSTWGMADTTGQNNFYFETNDVHAYIIAAGTDEGGRLVFRYNYMDNAGFGTHGADTSPIGQRYFEYYNNIGDFIGYSDGYSTFNMADGWVFNRGGTFVMHDNNLAPISGGTDIGPTRPDLQMTVMNLQRNQGPNPCWGQGTAGGANYYAPRQQSMGYVTGTGHDGLGRSNDSVTYVGDPEPSYIWGNNRQPLTNISISDYGTGSGNSCSGILDTSVNYVILNRDYFNGSTAKPGYTPYTYPHPLASGSTGDSSSSGPSAPSNLTAVVN